MRSIVYLAPLIGAATLAGSAHAAPTIHLFPTLGPGQGESGFQSPSYAAYANNVLRAVLDDQSSRGGSLADTPTAFNTYAGRKLGPWDVIATEFPTWRGDFTPEGAFAGEMGTQLRMAVRVESETAFNLTQIHQFFTNPGGTDEFTLAERLSIPGFTPLRGIGIWYGEDGVRGTADDVVCETRACDPATQMLNLIAYIGPPKIDSIDYAGLDFFYGGDLSAFHDDWYNYIATGLGFYDPPMFNEWNYVLRSADGSDLTTAHYRIEMGVPEPATWSLMILGFGAVGAALRRRRTTLAQASSVGGL